MLVRTRRPPLDLLDGEVGDLEGALDLVLAEQGPTHGGEVVPEELGGEDLALAEVGRKRERALWGQHALNLTEDRHQLWTRDVLQRVERHRRSERVATERSARTSPHTARNPRPPVSQSIG